MKKLLTTILVFLPLFSFSQIITDGLVGYWPFNGNALDESGNGNNGTVYGATSTIDRSGNANSAFKFDGVDDYIQINNPIVSQAQGTILFWVKVEKLQNDMRILGPVENIDFALRILTNGSVEVWRPWQLIIPGNFNVYEWNMFAIVVDENKTVTGYLNGVKTAQVGSTLNWSHSMSLGNKLITANGTIYGTNLNGYLDDFMIYDRVLTDAEIARLYESTNSDSNPIFELCKNFYCHESGVSVGTTSLPEDYMLAVNGKAIMEEVKVQLKTSWPDYVFDKEYPLKSLSELDQFIKEKKHLPELPSAMEVKENGIYLGEMDAKLLQKIEELTLYLIEQNKKIEELILYSIEQEKKIEAKDEINRQVLLRLEKLENQ